MLFPAIIIVRIVAILDNCVFQSTPIRVSSFLAAQVESALIVCREIVLGRLRLRRIFVSWREQSLQQLLRTATEIVVVIVVQGELQRSFRRRLVSHLRELLVFGLCKSTGRQ